MVPENTAKKWGLPVLFPDPLICLAATPQIVKFETIYNRSGFSPIKNAALVLVLPN